MPKQEAFGKGFFVCLQSVQNGVDEKHEEEVEEKADRHQDVADDSDQGVGASFGEADGADDAAGKPRQDGGRFGVVIPGEEQPFAPVLKRDRIIDLFPRRVSCRVWPVVRLAENSRLSSVLLIGRRGSCMVPPPSRAVSFATRFRRMGLLHVSGITDGDCVRLWYTVEE